MGQTTDIGPESESAAPAPAPPVPPRAFQPGPGAEPAETHARPLCRVARGVAGCGNLGEWPGRASEGLVHTAQAARNAISALSSGLSAHTLHGELGRLYTLQRPWLCFSPAACALAPAPRLRRVPGPRASVSPRCSRCTRCSRRPGWPSPVHPPGPANCQAQGPAPWGPGGASWVHAAATLAAADAPLHLCDMGRRLEARSIGVAAGPRHAGRSVYMTAAAFLAAAVPWPSTLCSPSDAGTDIGTDCDADSDTRLDTHLDTRIRYSTPRT